MTLSLDSQLWIRRFHPAPAAKARLVCFPHAGGSASYFHPVSSALSPSVEVLAVQYPGRQDRRTDPLVDDLFVLADQLTEILGAEPGPLAFFGHSMGAIVAFELARRLEAAGRPPAVLIVSGSRAPSAPRSATAPADDEALIEELTSLGGTDASLLRDPELLKLFLPALRSDYRALAAYRRPEGGPLSCPIVAMVGDRDHQVPAAQVEAWAAETDAEFELRIYPGGHFYLAEQAAAVTAAIEEDLRRFGCLEAVATGER